MKNKMMPAVLPDSVIALLYRNLSDAVYIIDPDTSCVVDANQAGADDLGMTREELLQHSVLSLNADVSDDVQWQEIAQAIMQSGHYYFVGRHRRKDGSDFPVEVRTDFICCGEHRYFISVARDISRRQDHHDELKANDFVRAFALNEASDGLWDWDIQESTLFFSPQWYRMMGYGPDEISNPSLETWMEAIHPDDEDRVMEVMQAHLNGQSARYEAKYRLKNRSGKYLWVHDRGFVVQRDKDHHPLRMIGLVLDITESQHLAEQLLRQSQLDDLTGLYNRRTGYQLFEQLLGICHKKNQPMQVIMLDIDHFKQVNDFHGHLMGDRAIRHVADTLHQLLRQDDLLFRWGGEEFLLLCPNTLPETAQTILACILQRLRDTPLISDEHLPIQLSASAGMSSFGTDGLSISELVSAADKAMYQAKQDGRNRLCLAESACL